MSKQLKKLLDSKAAKIKAARAVATAAEANEGGLMTEAQTAEYDGLMASIKTHDDAIARERALIEAERAQSASPIDLINEPEEEEEDARAAARTGRIKVGRDLNAEKPFSSLGEQLMAIAIAGSPNREIDPRLQRLNAAATGAGESVPSDGGFLVQTDFSSEIIQRTYSIGDISSRVRRVPISPGSNGLAINAVDESSRVNGSRYGGVQVYWEGEGNSPAAKKPKFRKMDLKLSKLFGLMYATDELLEDSVAFGPIATQAFAEEINFAVEDAIWEGTGVGQPKGILSTAALVTVAKESGQANTTVNYQNVLKMWSRMWGRSRKNAAWFINQDVEPQLAQMSLAVGSSGGVPVYLPANGASDLPYSTLFGRPVIPVEYASTLGAVGDISLYDLSQYLMIDKGGVKTDASIHVRFIYDETAFRITYRCDGQPVWDKPLTPFKGNNTLSPFVNLAAR